MRLFLDTNVLVSAYENRSLASKSILFSGKYDLLINEYCWKETMKVLEREFGRPQTDLQEFKETVERKCSMLPTPNNNQFKKIDITDKSDRPIVCSALQYDCILVTEDRLLLKEARKYVRTMRPEDVPLEDE